MIAHFKAQWTGNVLQKVMFFIWTKDTTKQVRTIGDILLKVKKNRGRLTDNRAQNLITKFTDFTFATFDEYTSVSNHAFIVRPDVVRQDGSNFTCKQNAKEFFCVHALGIVIIRGTIVPPRDAKVKLLGCRRKRVRRPLAAPAWPYQPFVLYEMFLTKIRQKRKFSFYGKSIPPVKRCSMIDFKGA